VYLHVKEVNRHLLFEEGSLPCIVLFQYRWYACTLKISSQNSISSFSCYHVLLLVMCKILLPQNGEYVVMKHGRMGKPKQRELKITEDLKTLTWLPQKLMPTAYDDPRFSGLVDRVREVRLAREIDRECPQYLGTAVLRRSLKPAHADRALSIIWRHRTLDLEFEDAAVCQEVVTGLRELVAEVRDEAEA